MNNLYKLYFNMKFSLLKTMKLEIVENTATSQGQRVVLKKYKTPRGPSMM